MRTHLALRLFALPLLAATESLSSSSSSSAEDVLAQTHQNYKRRGSPLPPEPTIFNNKTVPITLELPGDEVEETIAEGNWLVEFYSPYCGHCRRFAPTWQTLYEYYYTQNVPVPDSTFTEYYDFHFAKVDCVSNGDICRTFGISSFPTIVYFQDGKNQSEDIGARDLKPESDWVEAELEKIRPGTRPIEALQLPEVGDDHAPEVDVTAPRDAQEEEAREEDSSTTTSTSTSYSQAPTQAKLPARIPNSPGRSLTLTAENFQRVVTMTRDPWFVKFYTSRCPHCQSMAPNWQAMARQMQGELNVGEVNCETEKRLCRDVQVQSYPTVMFFRGGERIEYRGLRGLGDLLSYANEALAAGEGVRDITASEFEDLEKKEEVIFLYLYDHATTSEDFKALERMTMSLIGHAKLVKSNDPILFERFKIRTWPRLLVSRDGKATYYNVLAPHEMRDYRKLHAWMSSVWLPIVPELTAANAREIMYGRMVVLGILSRDREDDFISAKREIKNAALEWIDKRQQAFQLERQELRDAKQLRIEEAEDRNDVHALRSAKQMRINMDKLKHREVGFAWVDGVFWERWIRTTYGIDVAEGDKVVITDEDAKIYWDLAATNNPITPSRTSILETLRHVVVSPPRISPKSTTTPLGHVYWVLRGQVLEHPLVSAGLGLLALVAIAMWSRRFVVWRSAEKGYFRVGEKNAAMDGILGGSGGGGGNGQGKTD